MHYCSQVLSNILFLVLYDDHFWYGQSALPIARNFIYVEYIYVLYIVVLGSGNGKRHLLAVCIFLKRNVLLAGRLAKGGRAFWIITEQQNVTWSRESLVEPVYSLLVVATPIVSILFYIIFSIVDKLRMSFVIQPLLLFFSLLRENFQLTTSCALQ